jgi:hypothetical protein
MAIERNGNTKNPKTRILRKMRGKMLDEERQKVSFVWAHITGNEIANIAAKTSLDDVIHPTETYPLQELAKWLTFKSIELRNLKWKESNNEMKARKSIPEWTKDTEELGRNNQVIITRVRTGYVRATHSYIIEKRDNTDCLFSNTNLTVEHILWTCKETEQARIRMNITKDVWRKG